MNNANPQNKICRYFISGKSLTVLKALKLFHTTELRRIVSRLNKIYIKNKKIVFGEYLKGNKFKTYKLVNVKK